MAHWYIGIDEHGNFNPSEPENDSYVCAVVTQADDRKREAAFQKTFKSIKSRDAMSKDKLLDFFHGIKHTPDFRKNILSQYWQDNPNVIYKIFKTEGRPFVVSNAQQWWVMAIQSVLLIILNASLFDANDEIHISIATRGLEYVGFYEPSRILEAQKEDSEGEKYLDLLKSYHNFLANDIGNWLKAKCQNEITVKCESASVSTLIALADQATNMVSPLYRGELPEGLAVELPCQSFLPNKDVGSALKNGDVLEALNIFLDSYFIKQDYKILESITKIFEALNQNGNSMLKTKIWESIINACQNALKHRGEDGKAVKRVSLLSLELEKEAYNIPANLQSKYFDLQSALDAHSGSIRLDRFELMETCIKESNEFKSPVDRWQSYLGLQLFKAQALFNGYNFNVDFLGNLLKEQKYITQSTSEFFGNSENIVDDNLAAILGTLGQAAAFRGEYKKALELFIEDYNYTSDNWKSQVASYIFVVYHRLQDWDKAYEWFEKQTGQKFEDFGKTISKSTSQWLTLDYFRLYALGLKQKRPLPPFPESCKLNRKGDYPNGLVSKWYGICQSLKGDRNAWDELNTARKNLEKGTDFAVKSLALPILKMGYKMASYDKVDHMAEKYQTLLEECKTSEGFVAYITGKETFDLDHKDANIWETAMMLPFNYA